MASRSVRIFAAMCLAAIALYAQNPVVSGRITDASEAAIPGAKVEMVSKATAIKIETTSNAEGYFVFPSQTPGRYDITASAQGFTSARQEGVLLEVGQHRTVNFKLEVGQLVETVTVTAQTPMLTVNQPDRGAVVENAFVKSIPLNTRNPLLLLNLTPGISPGGASAGSNTSTQSQTNNFRINGGRTSTSEILIDGAANTTPYNNQVSAIPQVDAVQEFKVYTSPYAAEFGRTGGGVVSFAIKSGSNTPHGTLHEFLRNSVLDANGWNANRAGQERQSFKRNQYGYTLGAPVYIPKLYDGRNRTFFFAAYEALRERSAARFTGTVPTELEKRGDFSQSLQSNGALIRIFDPYSTRPDPSAPAGVTRYIRDQFPGNVVPASLIHPVSQKVIQFYPAPNQPGTGLSNTNNFFAQGARRLDMDRQDYRIDHLVTSSHSVFFRYNTFENSAADPNYYGNIATPVQTPNSIPGVNWAGSHTWTMSPSMILEHQFSFNRTASIREPKTLGYDYTQLGFPTKFGEGQRVRYFPLITVSSLSGVGPTGSGYNSSIARSWQYKASLTHLRGKHTIKTGLDWRRYDTQLDIHRPLSVSASSGFTNGPNPDAAASGTGHGLASLMAGIASVTYNYRPKEHHYHDYWGFFIQDEIRVTPRLTLTPGLRYSVELPTIEKNNQYVYLDLTSASPLAGVVPGFPNLRGGIGFVGKNGRRTQLTDTNNFDPRLGLAYRVNEKTVVRSGFGIFHHPSVPWTDIAQGYQRETSSLTREADGYTPIRNLDDPFPSGIQMPTGSSLGLATNLGQDIVGPLRQQHVPYQIQWSLDVQRQLPWSMVVDLGYAGTSGVGLPSGYDDQSSGENLNQLPLEYMSLGSALNQTVPNPFYGYITDPTSTLSRATISRGQLLRPYPQFLDVIAQQTPIGHSTYHAMQMRVERRFDNGLALLFAWTHSKTIDNVGEIGNFLSRTPGVMNNYCYSCDRSLSYQHIPDIVRLSYRYELPFGVGKKYLNSGVLARVLGGWAVAGLYSWDNGQATWVTSPNDSASYGGGRGMRPMATGQPAKLSGGTTFEDGALYFNKDAFYRTPQYMFGNVSRTLPDVRDPGRENWDVLIEKRIAINERVGLDFRAEMFNAVNQVNWSAPTTSVTSADFGLIRLRQSNTPRQMQFGLRLSF